MVKNSDIYVITTLSQPQLIKFFLCRKNIQYYMLANPYFNKNSVENDEQETLSTFLLE